jgi:hypothetical protein
VTLSIVPGLMRVLRSTTADAGIDLQPSDQLLLREFVRLAKYNVCTSFVSVLMTYDMPRMSFPSCPSEVGVVRDTSRVL